MVWEQQATAMANGSALSAAYLAVGLGKGDELITTPRTIATAQVLYFLVRSRCSRMLIPPWRDHCCHHCSADHPRTKAISVAFGRLACRHASDP